MKKLLVLLLTVCFSLCCSAQSISELKKKAEQGEVVAQFNLAVRYDDGKGVTKDPKQAVYWYRKAAEQGLATAQYNLALCYNEGEGVTKDPKQAAYWFRKAAEQGDADAQYVLFGCYYKGEGVTKDPKQAAYWLRKAAEQGYADAQEILPLLEVELNNDGKPKDTSEQVFEVVSEMPSFPGGTQGLANYLGQNIKYPEVCEENGVQGRVVCSFIVEKDGSRSNVCVTKALSPLCDKEAVRLIKSMPRWVPGKQNGHLVRVHYNVPVSFRAK